VYYKFFYLPPVELGVLSCLSANKKRNRRQAVSLLEVSENLSLLIPPLEVLYVPTIAEKHQNDKKDS